MTWANVVQGRTQKRVSSNIVASQAKPNDCVQVDPGIVERFNEVERRTQVLRKLPPTTTTTSILDDLKRQCEVPIKDVVEAVVQDSLDRRRFYIRYRTVEQKRANARRGFTIGEIQIPPERSDVQGYIPDLPHYVSRDDVVAILSKYGNVVSGNFKTYQDTDIRCGGFDFELDLHVNKRLPGTIKMLNDVFTLKLKNDIMVCSYCDKFGHLHRHCRQKQADLMKKAELELQQQIEAANAEADLMDDDEQDEQEPPPQTQPTSAPTIDSGSSTETPIINQESGIADNPATNPVYPSSDPALPERSYKELDHTLQKIYREKHTEYSTIFSHHNSSDKKIRDAAWNDAVKEMKRQFDGQGQYTPFMEEREKRLQQRNIFSRTQTG